MRIEIWQPRWHDRVVLIATHKVRENNTIVFTKTKAYEGQEFHISGAEIRKHDKDTNGKIDCYAVPLNKIIGEKNEN